MFSEKVMHDYRLEVYPHKAKWYRGSIELPIGRFIHFFKYDVDKDVILRMSVKDYNNDEVFLALLTQIENHILTLTSNSLAKVPLTDKIENFDALIFAPFEYTILPTSQDMAFDQKQIQIIPIYCYEASGKETVKEFNTMLRNVILPTDWHRCPTPKILYKFSNPKHKYGTVGKSFVIDKEENIYLALKKFESNDCFMEVKNILEETLFIAYDKDSKHFKINNNHKGYDYNELIKSLHLFFRKSSIS